jgi:hypothetical protein
MSNEIGFLTDGSFFAQNTRGYMVCRTFYEPNRKIIYERTVVQILIKFVNCKLAEYTTTGIVEITHRKNFFRYDIRSTTEGESHYKLDLALVILTSIAYLGNILLHVKCFSQNFTK